MEFQRGTITIELAALQCRQCGNIGASFVPIFERGGPHFARANCKNCDAFVDWISWPAETPKVDRKRSRKKLRDLGDRCELCLRHASELPEPEKLEVHHVLEKTADDGPDETENLRVYCNACHSIVNWIRTYFGHYHARG